MKGFLSHYTPSLMNPEDLDAIFVQRDRLLTDLLENTENSILTEAKHHALLIGPRGIGKTHLISMIYHRVSANEVFQDKLKIAWLREEEWGIATFLDLLVRILNSLMEEYKDSNLGEQIKGLYSVSTEQAEQLAGHILKQYCQDQTLLLLMENLDEIFKGLDESGQQAFRAYLQNYGFITIVATSQSLFKGVQSRNLPFYGFFSPTHLKPLVLEEAVDLLANIAKWRGDQDLADLLITPLGKSRIRAIHHLAGGNHRIYIIFSQFLTTESLDSLVEPFMKTLDDLTPFYQSRMQFISPQQRKIIEYLCEQRGAIAVKEIAQHCFISPQTASSQLKQLREMGYVYSDSQGRESFYELQEPLMRICLEAKKRRGTPNQLFISFLRVWFSREELKNRLEVLPLEANFDRECTRLALAEMEVSDDPKVAALLRDYSNAWDNCNYLKMLEISEELICVRCSGMDWIKKAAAYLWIGNQEKILQSLNKAIEIELNNAKIWKARGLLFFLMANIFNDNKWISESLLSYDESIKLDDQDDESWTLKALLLTSNKIEESFICAQNAVDLNKNSYEVYLVMAINQLNQKDFNDALSSIDNSIALSEFNNISWFLKGAILAQKESFIDSVKCFNKSLELDTVSDSEFNIFITQTFAKPLVIQFIKILSKEVINFIFKSNLIPKECLKNSQLMLEIYAHHNLLDDLSGGLVESIKAINEPSTSDQTAQDWLEMWQNLAGQYDEFQVALNLLKIAVEYKINRDRRVLLQLPQEERQILEELLNPETV